MGREIFHKGAKEVATLTVAVREQAFTFKPVMEALQVLASGDVDWSKSFLVAHDLKSSKWGPSFDWKKSPDRRYASFEDFYHRELEATWGKWESLQHTYAQIVRGEISEADAEARIQRERAMRAQRVNADDLANVRTVGRPAKQLEIFDNKKDDVKNLAPTGNSETYAHRRLRKAAATDARISDIHQRVLDGELTAHAGMIEAGFRKRQASRKLTVVDRLLKLWAKASEDDRAAFRAKIDDLMEK